MISGLKLYEDFICEKEEQFLLNGIAKVIFDKRVPEIRYSRVVLTEIPQWLLFPIERLLERGLLKDYTRTVTINGYDIGEDIGKHIDHEEYGEVVTLLSLLSEAEMIFSKGDKLVSLIIPPRSLMQMQGESRHFWRHEVTPHKNPRYSILYRN